MNARNITSWAVSLLTLIAISISGWTLVEVVRQKGDNILLTAHLDAISKEVSRNTSSIQLIGTWKEKTQEDRFTVDDGDNLETRMRQEFVLRVENKLSPMKTDIELIRSDLGFIKDKLVNENRKP